MDKHYTAKTYREAIEGSEIERLAAEHWMAESIRRQEAESARLKEALGDLLDFLSS